MSKLKQAARQALEALEKFGIEVGVNGSVGTAITALREALAEQAEQEPVVKIHKYNEFQTLGSLNLPIGTKLYAAPVRTKDLTEAEIATLVQRNTIDGKIMPFALCEAVIAADREKNK